MMVISLDFEQRINMGKCMHSRDSVRQNGRRHIIRVGHGHQMLFTSGWLRTSLISFIGILRTCDWNLMGRGYLGIGILFLAGIIGYLAGGWKRKIFSSDRLLHITFLICMVIPCGLSIYYSFYSDYQPQGRYLMPMLIPLLYFVTTGLTLVLEKIPQKVNRMLYGGIYMFFILISAASFYYVHALI